MGLLILVSLVTLLMGVLVWVRKPSSAVNQLFLGLCIFLALWIVTNALFGITDGDLKYGIALLSYVAAGLVATFFLSFSMAITTRLKRSWILFVLGTTLSIISGMPGLLAFGIQGDSILTTNFIAVYGVWIVSYFITSICMLVYVPHLTRQRQAQARAVLIGAVMAMIGGAFCNLLLPVLGNYQFVTLGPLFSAVFVFVAGYSIVRQRLFDIRRTFVRFVAYALSVATLGAGFGYLASILLSALGSQLSTSGTIIVTSTGIAILFAPIKKLFDMITSKVFLRAEYDIQDSIDQMTRVFSQSMTVDQFKRRSSNEIAKIIKTQSVRIRESIPELASKYLAKHQLNILVRDDIEDIRQNSGIINKMQESNIAVIAPLIVQDNAIGYLVLGDKSNGTAYNNHDYEFIDIISDEMAIAYQNIMRLESIQTFNENLQERIGSATEELRASNRKLQELDESKDEFISMASHQLRTPLTTVKGYISMLLDGDVGEISPQQRKVLEEAFSSSQRMVYLIGDFLNVSRLQTGKFELELHEVDLTEVVGQEVRQMEDGARSRKMKLDYQHPAQAIHVSLDENKIRQVIMNFLDNAIYYSKPGDTIRVVLAQHANHISLKVTDHGMGVPAGERHRLFSKFYRASNAKKQRPDGTGIGLFMARKVVVAHGGSMIFETSEGKGSTFGFRLPVKKSD